MTSKTIKELWRIEGKHQVDGNRVQNVLYGFTGIRLYRITRMIPNQTVVFLQ